MSTTFDRMDQHIKYFAGDLVGFFIAGGRV